MPFLASDLVHIVLLLFFPIISLYPVPADELKGWQKASESVATEWVKEVSAKGYDGNKLLTEARALLAN